MKMTVLVPKTKVHHPNQQQLSSFSYQAQNGKGSNLNVDYCTTGLLDLISVGYLKKLQ